MGISVQPLTEKDFEPFGTIISASTALPMADNKEITYWGKIAIVNMPDKISTGIMHVHDREHVVTKMERHTKTSEILIAVEGDSVICLAAPSDHEDSITDINAFHIKKGDAIVLHRGTWHWAAFPGESEGAKFLVIFANDTEANDLETRELPEEIHIDF
ncbi:MAG: ureidoglycolate lyase [Eubacteriales bacterium]